MPDNGPSSLNDMEPITITSPGVEHLLQNIQPHRIPSPLLKELAGELSPTLSY
jgi:hypothetical protein